MEGAKISRGPNRDTFAGGRKYHSNIFAGGRKFRGAKVLRYTGMVVGGNAHNSPKFFNLYANSKCLGTSFIMGTAHGTHGVFISHYQVTHP